MKTWTKSLAAAAALIAVATTVQLPSLEVKVVNFKKCVEQSKLGKQEQANFDSLKKQMESILAEKEKGLNDLATKLSDPDYLDSLSPEAETDLKRKFRALNQEYTQQQSQYMQTLNQTNYQVIQKMNETITKITAQLAKELHLDLILNEEGCFYYSPNLDFSDKIISLMDLEFNQNQEKEKGRG